MSRSAGARAGAGAIAGRRVASGAAGVAAAGVLGLAAVAVVARRAAALYEAPSFDPAPDLHPVTIPGSDDHALPGWTTPTAGDGSRWVVALPGLGSHPLRHQETAAAFTELGYTCLFAAHSARWPARRHGFGVRETDEARAWLGYAAAHGAREVVLLGWSFGASLWLRVLAGGAPLPVTVRALVLTGPLVDWVPTIAHGVGGGAVGRLVGRAVTALLATPGLVRLAGQRVVLRLRPFEPAEQTVPLVVVHSDADRTVPLSSSRALVAAWSGPAQLHVVPGARHGAERDVDPAGWLDVVMRNV
jgi:alpha-beta hydrolase superfamily lysophospholipase